MAMDLVVQLEMLGRPIRTEATGAVEYQRTQMELDASNYDGATYYFEIVASTYSTTSYDIVLYDETTDAAAQTISTGTSIFSVTRIRSASFVPEAGNNLYTIHVPQTTAQNDVVIFTARIIVVQADATKTRLQFPLANGQYSSVQTDGGGSYDGGSASFASYTQVTPHAYALWLKEAGAWATLDGATPWCLEQVHAIASAGGTVYSQLFNATDDTAVTGAINTHTGDTAITYDTVDFADDATNFHDGDEFEMRHYTSNTSYYIWLYKANLYVTLTSLNKASVYTRIGMMYSGTGGGTNTFQRIYYDAAQWEADADWYLEATGIDASASPTANEYVRYDTADDAGSGDGYLAQTLTWGATKDRLRSGLLTLTDEYRYMCRNASSTSTCSVGPVFLIAVLDVPSGTAPTVTTKAITDITASTATGGGIITDEGSSAVTAYGVCWNTTGSPTVADDHTDDS